MLTRRAVEPVPITSLVTHRAFFPRPDSSIVSPLRYPGSKRRLAGYISRALTLNRLDPELFVEPFAGGLSVGLQLLNDGLVKRLGLADRDPGVAAFWWTVFNDAEWLIDQVGTIPVTLENWRRFKKMKPRSTRMRAIRFFFLNRTSYSGIVAEDAGPIGGYQRSAQYPIDCRFPRKTLIRRIQQANALRHRVAFTWNLSWSSTFSRLSAMQSAGSLPRGGVFYYLDPPFIDKADALYPFYFLDSDHVALSKRVLRLRRPWLLSYDASPRVVELYGRRRRPQVLLEQLYTSSGSRGNVVRAETIVTNLRRLPRRSRLWGRSEEW